MHQLLYSDSSLAFPLFPFFFMEKKKRKRRSAAFYTLMLCFFSLLFFNRRRRRCGADRNVPNINDKGLLITEMRLQTHNTEYIHNAYLTSGYYGVEKKIRLTN